MSWNEHRDGGGDPCLPAEEATTPCPERKIATDEPDAGRRAVLKGLPLAAGFAALQPLAGAAQATKPHTQDVAPIGVTGVLQGQVAIVTGAARGIGQAIAVTLAQAGANIIAFDILSQIPEITDYPLATQADMQQTQQQVTAAGVQFIAIQGDVRKSGDLQNAVTQALNQFGRLDIMVANAGVQIYDLPLANMTDDQWQVVLDVNLTGAGNSLRAAIPPMMKAGQGTVICITSVEGRTGDKGSANYSASKWGIIGLIKSAAMELGRNNIRVNGIAPGAVFTTLTQNAASYASVSPQNPTQQGWTYAQYQENQLPFGYLFPQDIAQGVLYLASYSARYITGTVLTIDMGRLAQNAA
jgi:NAD(P)-dependent dehydrogenase (short-subunit alcohol dehydrogenase family)